MVERRALSIVSPGMPLTQLWCTFAKNNTWSEFYTYSMFLSIVYICIWFFQEKFPWLLLKSTSIRLTYVAEWQIKTGKIIKKQRREQILQGIHQEYSITINFYLSKRAKTRSSLKKMTMFLWKRIHSSNYDKKEESVNFFSKFQKRYWLHATYYVVRYIFCWSLNLFWAGSLTETAIRKRRGLDKFL